MNLLSVTLNPIFYILLIYILGFILLLNSDKNILIEIFSYFYFYLALCLYYFNISDNYFSDYLSYLDWIKNAEYFLNNHIDIFFSYMMLFLHNFENLSSFKILVLLLIFIYLIILKFELPINISIFSALFVTNPRSLEFLFNSTRASLCTLLVSLCFIYIYKKKRLLSLITAFFSLGFHFYTSSFFIFISCISFFTNLKILLLLLFFSSVFYLLAINLASSITNINELLLYLLNSFKDGNIDEYLFIDVTTSLTGRLSIIFFIIQPVLFAIYLSYKKSLYNYFQNISVLTLSISLFIIFIFPVAFRFAFLSLIISYIIISANLKLNNRFHLIFLVSQLTSGIYIILNNSEFVFLG